MKKTIFYLLILFFIVILFPLIATKRKEKIENISEKITENQNKEENKEQFQEYDYKKFKTIELYLTKTNQIEEILLDEYLYGVVSAEIPVIYDLEALKAQAIAARTYTLYQIINKNGKHLNSDICDNYSCCQAWLSKEDRMSKWKQEEAESNWEKIENAVKSTQGAVITYNGKVIDAFFHSNSGGITETASNVWGGNNYPYLKSVEIPGEDEYSQYLSEEEFSKEELINKIKTKYPSIEINFDEENAIEIIENTESGRVKKIKFGNTIIAGTEARTLLGLKSTNFSYEITEGTIKFTVKGYGHGVGMSQTGANSLAKSRI